jgi:hypothetical protein
VAELAPELRFFESLPYIWMNQLQSVCQNGGNAIQQKMRDFHDHWTGRRLPV